MSDPRLAMSRRLSAFERLLVPDSGKPRAAVAIVVSPTEQGPAFILTKRARHLRRNADNYALPGGHVDAGETLEAAAIRETWEELGVTLDEDAALGLLDDFETLTGRIVTPVVLWSAQPLTLRPNPEEVGEAWLLPIAQLDASGSPRFVDDPAGGPPILQPTSTGTGTTRRGYHEPLHDDRAGAVARRGRTRYARRGLGAHPGRDGGVGRR